MAGPQIRATTYKIALEMICPYEPGKPIEEVQRELGLTTVIKLGSNENPLGPPRAVIDTLNSTSLGLELYPDFEGWGVRKALSQHLGVPFESLVIGAGSCEIIRLVADAYLDASDEAVVSDLCFPVYADAVRIAGGKPVVVPVDSDLRYDLERMLGAVTHRTKLVFLATPNNPTGRRTKPADLLAFVERLPPWVLCVIDLAYCEYLTKGAASPLQEQLLQHPNVLILRTFSKAYGLAGLRIGYGIAPEEVIRWLARVRIPFSTSTAAQVAARIALEDHEHVARTVALNQEMLELLERELKGLGVTTYPSQANFILADTGIEADEVFQGLLRRGSSCAPCAGSASRPASASPPAPGSR